MTRNNHLLLALTSGASATLRGGYDESPNRRRKLSTTVPSISDATLRSEYPYTNYGLDDDLSFIGEPTAVHTSDVESLIMFDLSSTGYIYQNAKDTVHLQLYTGELCTFSSTSHSTQLGLFEVGLAGNNMKSGVDMEEGWRWEEESVTWFNAPALKRDGANGGKMVKSLGDFTGQSWLEIDITSLLSELPTPLVTLRLSSTLFAHSDDNMSLCAFASRNYRNGMFAPRLVVGGGSSAPSNQEIGKMNILSANVIGIQNKDDTQESSSSSRPYKLFPSKISSMSATTEKVTKCAPPYSPSATYAHNDVVSSDFKNYRCKSHPYTVWCSDQEYEPGVSLFWGLAWDMVNACKTEVASIHSKDSDRDTDFTEPNIIKYEPSTTSSMTLNSQSSSSSKAPLCPDKWNSAYPYTTGDRVTLPSTLIIYECKDMPYGHYCAHEAYEVGLEGGVYENAWGVVGKCVNGRVVEDDHFLDGKSHSDAIDAIDEPPTSLSSSSNLVRPTAVMEQNSNVVPQDLEEVLKPFLESNAKCNLCQPGQIGINADIPLDGCRTMKCIDIYEYYLQNHLETTKQCMAAQNWLNKICCGSESLMDSAQSTTITSSTTTSTTQWTHYPTKMPISLSPTPLPTPPSIPRPSTDNASLASIYAEDYQPNCAPPYNSNDSSYTRNDQVSSWGGNYICMKETWCSQADFEPRIGQYWEVVWEYQGTCKGNARPTNPDGFRPLDQAKESTDENNEQPPPPPSRPSVVENVVTAETVPTEIAESIQEPAVSEGLVVSTDPTPPPPRPTEVENDITTEISGAIGDDPQCPEAWKIDYDYAEGDTVSAKGQIYTCKEFPYTGWCGQEGYEPANSEIWSSAWTLGADCVGGDTREPTARPSNEPTPVPTSATPTDAPVPTTPSPTRDPSSPTTTTTTTTTISASVPDNDPETLTEVYQILEGKKDVLDNEIFLYQGSEPSTVYRYDGFVAGLRVMTESGVAGKFYYLGNDDDKAYLYGLVNLAAFIGQSMKETIQYDACDENSWDLVDGKYPLSNACGQLGQKYQEYHCSEEEKHMECPVDPNMSIKGVTHAKWYGAPGPLFCGPKTEYPFTGYWDYGYGCNNPWAEPPEYCEDYEGQKAGRYDNSEPIANVAGRTDVEGCCWWGRGVIQTTGICNFGKLNYFLGARAAEEGRESRYPDIDFCKDPEAICASQEHQELKWIAGMFYWIESLQSYDERGWNYIAELHKFVAGGMEDTSFINGVSGVVNRGCHDPPCGTGEVDGMHERATNFDKVLKAFLA